MPVRHSLGSPNRRVMLCGGGHANRLENSSATPLSALDHAFLNGPDASTRILNTFGGHQQLQGSTIGTSNIAQPKTWLTRPMPAHSKMTLAPSGTIGHSTNSKGEAYLGRSQIVDRVAAQVNDHGSSDVHSRRCRLQDLCNNKEARIHLSFSTLGPRLTCYNTTPNTHIHTCIC